MAEKVIINVEFESCRNDPETNRQGRSKNTRKRKRVAFFPENMSVHEKEAQIEAFQKELNGLCGYFKEVEDQKVHIELSECRSPNAVIAALMEESHLPLSGLIYEICDKLNKGNGLVPEPVTYASVKTSVLFVGQRLMYGVPNPDADVLEDDSRSCFWCWETRDLKLFPKSVRGQFGIRRTCRRRIRERIMAISEMIAALKKPESEHDYKKGLMNASEKLGKAFPEADIRLLVDGLLQKNSIDLAEKAAKQEEKLILKQLKENRREVEREIKSKHNEILHCEKDLEGEARKDERSCNKNGSERRKHQRKHQELTEKDQRRREKEEAEMKEKHSLQKQASMMERFLKRGKASPPCQNDQLASKAITSESSSRETENVSDSATISMDCTLALHHEVTIEDIQRSHWSSWRHLGHSIRSNRKQGWGLRQKPKTELIKELKLAAIGEVVCDVELGVKKAIDGWKEQIPNSRSHPTNAEKSLCARKFCHGKQLLQFDNSHRPAFYGIWPKKSHVVGPRHPLRKDPSLDYDVSSDEEWEEEDPGESLSDLDKDEEESLEECSKSDDEGEDGFFVPDGYLSEDEGALAERMERDIDIEGLGGSPSYKDDLESDEFYALLHQQKYLANLTEHALRKNQPLIIQNFMYGEDYPSLAHNLGSTPKLEKMCLQALCMHMIPGSSYIEISVDKRLDEDQEACLSTGKDTAASASDMAGIPDSDLPIIVTTIQTCSEGMNKVLESLQQKFPAVSKSLLRIKVREVSDYVDNRLQVKKEVLVRLGLALYPEKSSGGARSITTFFSKRCLPPTSECMNPCETSPVPSLKSNSAAHEAELNT